MMKTFKLYKGLRGVESGHLDQSRASTRIFAYEVLFILYFCSRVRVLHVMNNRTKGKILSIFVDGIFTLYSSFFIVVLPCKTLIS